MRFPISLLLFIVVLVAIGFGAYRLLAMQNYHVDMGSQPVEIVRDGKTIVSHQLVNVAVGDWGQMELRTYERSMFWQWIIEGVLGCGCLIYGCWRWPRRAQNWRQFLLRLTLIILILSCVVAILSCIAEIYFPAVRDG